MRTVLVVGANGLVGTELCELLSGRGDVVVRGDLPECDVADRDRFESWARECEPEWVVNLAAVTNVDGCEADPGPAFRVNGRAPGILGQWAWGRHARLLHVSSDYVYDGRKGAPYTRRDPANPLSAYGMSKLAGEYALEFAMPEDQFLVVRGQSLYGRGAKSFPDAILAAAAAGKTEIPVVTDQRVSPTWSRDFGEGLVHLMDRKEHGTVLLSAAGDCTWNEFARAVLEEAGVTNARITETTAAALARPARRPARSVFDLGELEEATGLRPRPWREQLRDYLRSRGRAA